MRVRKKPIEVSATQWFQRGDHPKDKCDIYHVGPEVKITEGKIVRYYRNPIMDGKVRCDKCQNIMHLHGWIDTLEGGHIVCPGDWIITGVQGEYYPCKPDIFEETYDKLGDEE